MHSLNMNAFVCHMTHMNSSVSEMICFRGLCSTITNSRGKKPPRSKRKKLQPSAIHRQSIVETNYATNGVRTLSATDNWIDITEFVIKYSIKCFANVCVQLFGSLSHVTINLCHQNLIKLWSVGHVFRIKYIQSTVVPVRANCWSTYTILTVSGYINFNKMICIQGIFHWDGTSLSVACISMQPLIICNVVLSLISFTRSSLVNKV